MKFSQGKHSCRKEQPHTPARGEASLFACRESMLEHFLSHSMAWCFISTVSPHVQADVAEVLPAVKLV